MASLNAPRRESAYDDGSELSLQRRLTANRPTSGDDDLGAAVSRMRSSDTGFSAISRGSRDDPNGKKGAPQISKSIRNFITAAFKKDKDHKPLDISQISAPIPIPDSPEDLVQVHSGSHLTSQPPPPAPSELVALHSGALYHLYRDGSNSDSGTSSLPIWLQCFVTLDEDKITVTQHSVDGLNLSVCKILLAECADVRSITTEQLESLERSLLPSEVDVKLFELEFDGKPREKFAALTLQDRAAWVGAIW